MNKLILDKSKFLNLGLAIGKVISTDVKDRAHILVQLNRYNQYIKTYFPDKEYLEAYNPDDLAKVGDIILIKKMESVRKVIETHKIIEIIFSAGMVIDPMTGIRVDGDRYSHESKIDSTAIRDIAESIKHLEHPQKLMYHKKLREFTHGEKF